MANVNAEPEDVDRICINMLSLIDHEEKGQNCTNKFSPSIYLVPPILRDLSPSSFNPRVVSIGPLHKENENLLGFEGQKVTYVHKLLCCLKSPPEQTLKACVKLVHASIDRIRACYDGMKTYTDFELATMMVMDGCFIVYQVCSELCIKHCSKLCNKPRYESSFVIVQMTQDLVLLENQIPFFVLKDIFECTILKLEPTASLTNLLLTFLNDINPFDANFINDRDGPDLAHILDLLHKSYQIPARAKPPSLSSIPSILSVVELDRAGVNFKPNPNKISSMAMKYEPSRYACFHWSWGKPTLRMPVLRIEDSTETVLKNLIAYEQLSPVDDYFTSYQIAMDMLVDGKADIVKLVESKVLFNDLGSNEEAANMINSLGKEVVYENFYYYEQWQQLESYYNGYWPRNIARLRRTYFNSPWNIALLAGILLFTLTVVQTIFTINPV